jgi:hypothetical protein
MAKMMCQPVFELWLADEVAEERISAPGFFQNEIVKAAWCAAIWTGDGPGSIDPSKEVDAAAKRVALGISTKQAESILHDGVDWEQKHEQRVKETNAEKRDGIYIQPAGSPVQTSAQPAAEDAPPAKDDGSAAALAALSARMDSLADKAPPNITIHTPAQSQQGVNLMVDVTQAGMEAAMSRAVDNLTKVVADMPIIINVPAQPAPVVNVAAPEITVEAIMPPAQVIVNGPKSSEQKIKRSDSGDLLSTVITHTY